MVPPRAQVQATDRDRTLDTLLSRFTMQDLRPVVDGFNGRTATQPENRITHSNDIQQLATNIFKMEALLNLLRGPPPTPMAPAEQRQIYTGAVNFFGHGDLVRAQAAIREAQMVTLGEMPNQGQVSAQTLGNNADPLVALLDRFTSSHEYTNSSLLIAHAANSIRGVEVWGGALNQSRHEANLARIGDPQELTIFPLAFGGGSELYITGGLPIEASTIFGTQSSNFVSGYGGALGYLFSPGGTATRSADMIESQLRTALSIPGLRNDSQVQAALAALNNTHLTDTQKLTQVVNLLQNDTNPAFTGVLSGVQQHLYAVQLSQMGATVFSFALNIQVPLINHDASIASWLEGGAEGFRVWPLTQLTVGIRELLFSFTGQYQLQQATFGSGSTPVSFRNDPSVQGAFRGSGNSTEVTPSVTSTIGIFNRPVDVICQVEVGWRNFSGGTTVQRTSTGINPATGQMTQSRYTDTLNVSDQSVGAGQMYLGLWGVTFAPKPEVRLDSAQTRIRPTWYVPTLSQATIAGYGGINNGVGGLMSLTIDWARLRSEDRVIGFDTFITAQGVYIGGQVRQGSLPTNILSNPDIGYLGFSVNPQLTISPSSAVRFRVGVTGRYEADAISWGASRLTGGGMLGVDFPRAGVGVTASLEYAGAFGSQAATREPPNTVQGGLEVTLRPAEWFSRAGTVRPTRVAAGTELSATVQRAYQDLITFMTEHPNDNTSDQARSTAVALRNALNSPLNDANLLSNNRIESALDLLNHDPPNIAEAMDLLGQVPVFQALTPRPRTGDAAGVR